MKQFISQKMLIFIATVLFSTSLHAHSQAMLKRYYNYYNFGFDYSKSILNDVDNNQTKALVQTQKMCLDTIGSPYLDKLYKESCIYGAKDARQKTAKIAYENFLESYIHKN